MQVVTGIPVHAPHAKYGPVATTDTESPALPAPAGLLGLPPHAAHARGRAPEPGQWSTGLCDCFDDMKTCCYGTWCMPCLFAVNMQSLDASYSWPVCCISIWGVSVLTAVVSGIGGPCLLSGPKRTKLRAAYGLPASQGGDCGEDFDDFCVHLWCPGCAICQEHRELRARGASPDRPACTTGSALPVVSAPPQAVGVAVEMEMAPSVVVGIPSVPNAYQLKSAMS